MDIHPGQVKRQAAHPEHLVGCAVAAVRAGEEVMRSTLDALPAPIYLTDAEGIVTFFNQACADFAGRTPVPGEDRWCVTWKLYTEQGDFLPHDRCPMAVAVKEKRPVRGAVAVAERPDGSRVLFTPYPTPIFDDEGELAGAVNILIDVTDSREARRLANEASRCRRLAQALTDGPTVDTLMAMARDYEEQARALEGRG